MQKKKGLGLSSTIIGATQLEGKLDFPDFSFCVHPSTQERSGWVGKHVHHSAK